MEPPIAFNNLCGQCESAFPRTGPWAWDDNEKPGEKLWDQEWNFHEFTIQELDRSATHKSCHLCRQFLDSLVPQSLVVNNYYGYPEWLERHKNIRYQLTLSTEKEGEHDEGLRSHWLTLAQQDQPPSRKPVFDIDMFVLLRLERVRPSSVRVHDIGGKGDFRRDIWTLDVLSTESKRLHPRETSPVVAASQPWSTTNFDPLSFDQIRRWVSECSQDHKTCAAQTRPSFPKSKSVDIQTRVRFVDLGADSKAHIKLVEGFIVDDVKYITLSYRWTAETPRTSLKTHNRALYLKNIPTKEWPQIYHDAVFASRALGIRYIWIDSLCIIQDDAHDWDVQASMMHRIYAGGFLNLAGLLGEHCSGLKVTRNPLGVSPCVLSRSLAFRSSGDLQQEYWICHREHRPLEGLESLETAALYSRGWTYQERFLSMRTVHFGQQLYWECRERHASEAFPVRKALGISIKYGGYDTHPDTIGTALDGEVQKTVNRPRGESAPPLQLHIDMESHLAPAHIWEGVIQSYYPTTLTKQSDKLVALRGIFNKFRERFAHSVQQCQEPDWCIAGLLKAHFTRQLLWVRRASTTAHKGNGPWWTAADLQLTSETLAAELLGYFPSFSWASCPMLDSRYTIDFPANSSWHNRKHVEDLIHVERILPMKHSYGRRPDDNTSVADYTAFESAQIILRGMADTVQFNFTYLMSQWKTDADATVYSPGTADDGTGDTGISVYLEFDRPPFKRLAINKPGDLKILPVLFAVNMTSDKKIGNVVGLLVQSLGTSTVDGEGEIPTFRRMGYCEMSSRVLPGCPERFDTHEMLNEFVADLRERRTRFPLLLLV